MRWGYLVPRLVIIGIIWAFMTFGFDPLLRKGTVAGLQSVTGARVDLSDLRTGFFPPHMEVGGVQIADPNRPGKNLIAFDHVDLKLSGKALLRRNYVVEEAVIDGVIIGSERVDDGRLEHEEEADNGAGIPPWLTDKLKSFGDKWLTEMTGQLKGQLDPNTLESYRVGTEIYGHWEVRFQQMQAQYEDSKRQFDSIQQEVETVKKNPSFSKDPVGQIERYLQLAQRADALLKQSQQILNDMRTTVPEQVKLDYQKIDAAQQVDRDRISSTLQVLKPDPDRITESLLGPQLYLKLQNMLSWVSLARDYQQQLQKPEAPTRARGRTYEFPVLDPTPRYLARQLKIAGHFSHEGTLTPFVAELNNVTDDPQLLGLPAVLTATTHGGLPVNLRVIHDATQQIATTSLEASYADPTQSAMTVGQEDGDQLVSGLGNFQWVTHLAIQEGQISGAIDMQAQMSESTLKLSNPHLAPLARLTSNSLAGINTVSARLNLSGPLARPDVKLQSDLGRQLSSNFQTSLQTFVPEMKREMLAVVDKFVADEKQQFHQKLGSRYQTLVAEHSDLLKQLDSVRTIAMDLRKGKLDARSVFSTVSETGVLSEKDQKKTNKVLNQADQIMKGLNNPNEALRNALPRFRSKLFD